MKITYNSPTILTFSFIAVAIQMVASTAMPAIAINYFSIGASFDLSNPIWYFRLSSHVLGHSGWPHLLNNIIFILLLGPLLEEKYGSKNLLVMIIITAVITGLANITLFYSGLLGASGIVFMLILLGSITDIRQGEIPLTFILVAIIFIGKEVTAILNNDNISQMAHIIGGLTGGAFGFLVSKPKKVTNSFYS